MKFFTRSWVDGQLTDEEAAAVVPSYWHYLSTLNLPPNVDRLAHINSHDAYVLGAKVEPGAGLMLRLRCGDLQCGYSDVLIEFVEPIVDSADLDVLLRAVRPSELEVSYDEVDRVGDDFDYRLLFWPRGEVNIRFRNVEVSEMPVTDRNAK